MDRQPWTRSSSEVLAKLFGKALVKETWAMPDGTVEDYGMISQKDWVVVLAITTDNQVVVVNEFKPGREDFGDELPAGTAIEPSDTWDTIARRAIMNEAGFSSSNMLNLGTYFMATRNSHTTATLVLARNCTQTGQPAEKEATEINWRLVPFAIWLTMVLNCEVTEWSAGYLTLMALSNLGWTLSPPK